MPLELVAKNTDDDVQIAKTLREMFINLQCPRYKIIVRSALELEELTDRCTQCR